jgi:hypothetical protein
VIVDDKLRILDAIKRQWQRRVTTVFVQQGHYATDADALTAYSPADLTLDRINKLATALRLAATVPGR